MTREEDIKRERIAIYFDCILGISISTFCIMAILVHTTQLGIQDPFSYALGLGFWIFILICSLLLMYEGIHIYYLEKKHPEGIPSKKPVKAPIFS